ncbi:MAG: hypothetical protein WKF84_30595 [Pyrinomonadaceae bacterium]
MASRSEAIMKNPDANRRMGKQQTKNVNEYERYASVIGGGALRIIWINAGVARRHQLWRRLAEDWYIAAQPVTVMSTKLRALTQHKAVRAFQHKAVYMSKRV